MSRLPAIRVPAVGLFPSAASTVFRSFLQFRQAAIIATAAMPATTAGTCKRCGVPANTGKLTIDFGLLVSATNIQELDGGPKCRGYLDRQTGNALFVHLDDAAAKDANVPAKDNRALHRKVLADPQRYIQIPQMALGAPARARTRHGQ